MTTTRLPEDPSDFGPLICVCPVPRPEPVARFNAWQCGNCWRKCDPPFNTDDLPSIEIDRDVIIERADKPFLVKVVRAENEELKQWMSDACELLHNLRRYVGDPVDDDRIVSLLRRAENP